MEVQAEEEGLHAGSAWEACCGGEAVKLPAYLRVPFYKGPCPVRWFDDASTKCWCEECQRVAGADFKRWVCPRGRPQPRGRR